MRITQDSINQILQAADIVEVVGDFVSLKKRGANYAALSPFTNEKTPSFYVSPSKGIFKCFSTGKGGDALKFVMEVDKLTYVEALKYLAKKYAIEVQYDKTEFSDAEKEAQSEKDSLFIILEHTKNYYKNILLSHPDGMAIGKSYFIERGLNDKTIAEFELGFALDSWDGLLNEPITKQFNQDLLAKAGVIKISENGKKFDFFRNRVMFPIHNITGKTIALAGRILGSDKGTAKYINSPETELYVKNQVLYGLFQAKQSIRNQDNCLLVEGYMDVLSLYQAGITNAVASSGTSLTEGQIKLIARYTKNVIVLYDGDKAGIKAAIRGTDMLLDSGLNIKVLVFPDGDDPDSFVNKVGATAFIEYLTKNAKDFITFKTEVLLQDSANDPLKKGEVIHEIINSIAKIKDEIQRSLYFRKCSQLLEIDEQVIVSEYNKIKLGEAKKQQEKAQNLEETLHIDIENKIVTDVFARTDSNEIAEREIIRILLEYADVQIEEQTLIQIMFSYLQNITFEDPIYAKIIEIFKLELAQNQLPTLDYFMKYPDVTIEERLINILTSKHELSNLWYDKYQIYITPKDNDKMILMNKSLARLNFEKFKKRNRDNQLKLNKLSDAETEEINALLDENIELKKYLQIYAKELGIVISG
ncbi:MAG: DNA primase [Bacteroidetes bacterium]|nr:MAG: DNA primase [Bacteroidota bacterium]